MTVAKGVPASGRFFDVMNLAWISRMRERGSESLSRDDLKKSFFANLSQCCTREPWGKPPTLCRGTLLFSFEAGLLFTPSDHLQCLGLGNALSYGHSLSNADCRSLAGEAFSAPVVASALQAFFLNRLAPWWAGPA
jgi:hypothetical protein